MNGATLALLPRTAFARKVRDIQGWARQSYQSLTYGFKAEARNGDARLAENGGFLHESDSGTAPGILRRRRSCDRHRRARTCSS
ncbi:protein of unknown function [Hyphomicrobium sp. MC1]|nr:protein of unknown function [Hyphomicrobium sp. MC1]